jgi:aryl-alcohol dehydrogenase-like predicted oxidoreductase
LAIAWVLAQGEDIVPLVGMSRRACLGENLKALDVTLTKEELSELDRTFALGAITGERYPAQVRHLSAK